MTKFFATACIATLFFCAAQSSHAQNKSDNLFEISKNLDIYYALFKDVNEYYVDPVQPGKLMKKSIDEMLNNLDPYTNYITEDDIEDYRFQTTGKYGGIGCSMRDLGEYLAIDELVENGPAQKAGLQAGDMIIEIEGKDVKNKNDEEVGKLVKGSPGTTVRFKVKHPLTNAISEKTVTRGEIALSNIVHSALLGNNNKIAYVRLNQFTERAAQNMKQALDSLKKASGGELQGAIIDLRGNPGGLLEEAVSICNLFIGRDQLVVSTKGKVQEWDKNFKTTNMPWDEKLPVSVLINKGSASASEIVSGTLQDLDRGVIVGQKSYGKGLVQSTRSLPFNAKLKVTTAKYYTPSGRCIQALDYTNRNEDGSVGEIPDSMKRAFTTKSGRKVYDGGGVDPDIKTTAVEYSKLSTLLASKNYMFQYATEYASKHPTIASKETFNLTDAEVDDFITWLSSKDYKYKTRTAEAIEKIKDLAQKEKYFDEIKPQLESIEKTINSDKKADLVRNKADIKKILQMEIVSRYYFYKGRAVNDMQQDADLKEALNVLQDQARYKKILNN